MNAIQIIEAFIGAIVTVIIATVVGWVKLNRQVETLETKFEAIEKDMSRHESEHKEIKSMFADIKSELADLRILLAKNQISD